MQPAEDMTAISKIDAHPIFSFADGEMGPLANCFIRAMEKVTGQPKIKKIYFDYVDLFHFGLEQCLMNFFNHLFRIIMKNHCV